MKPGYIAPNFKWRELLESPKHKRLGLTFPCEVVEANRMGVGWDHITNLCETAWTLLVPIREHLGFPLVVTSGYRLPALNTAVDGSLLSQHMVGEAVDVRPCPQRTKSMTDRLYREFRDSECYDLFLWCKNNLKFGQLIFYGDPETKYPLIFNPGHSRIHISTAREDMENGRVEVRSAI